MSSVEMGEKGHAEVFNVEGMDFSVSFGSKRIQLPFSVYLNEFIMDRYPGTDSPESYASEVTLIDEREQIRENHRIYMNHVLDHDGFRFFQSSFDQDETRYIPKCEPRLLGYYDYIFQLCIFYFGPCFSVL